MNECASLGQWIAARRKSLRLRQNELARMAACAEITLRKIEADERRPSSQLAEALAFHLTSSPDEHALFLRVAQGERQTRELPAPAVDVLPGAATATRLRRDNLPAQLTRFIGRANDVAEVKRLLGATRLLTLTGSGGAGKTRLAQEVALSLAKGQIFADGVWLVELAPLTNPKLVADAIAVAFGLRPTSQPARALLIERLRDRHALLVLDNCEHLINECAKLAEAMLRACPRLCILATSREPLNVPGEVTWRVPSLATGDAVQLFAARAARPDFQLNDENRIVVARICERLDNIPLAIELAASRLRAFSVEQIAARLDDRFHLLTSGARTALPRHQTLRALIDWSYGLLLSEEQRLLRWLSVFAGGWTFEATEAIYGAPDAADVLAQLVNKSLVVVDESGSEPRYTMLETIRQYGQDKLAEMGEEKEAREHHLNFLLDLLQKAKTHLHGPDQVMWLDRLEAEIDNLRTALAWVMQTSKSRQSERLIDGIWWMWYERGYYNEGLKWIDDLLTIGNLEGNTIHATAHVASGWLATRMSNFSHAADAFTQAVSIARNLGDDYWIVWANIGLGFVVRDYGEATQALDEAIQLACANNLKWEEIEALAHLGVRSRIHGDLQRAEQLLAETLADFRQMGDAAQSSWVLWNLGQLKFKQGDTAQARQMLEESVVLARGLKFPIRIAYALVELATIALHQRDDAQAMEAVQECILIYHSIGNLDRIGQCLSIAAGVAHLSGNVQRAALLLGSADRLWRESGSQGTYYQDIHAEFGRLLPIVRAAMKPAEFERAFAEGQHVSLRHAMDAAMTL